MYSLVQKIDTEEFQVMTLDTKTGKIEGKIPLNPLLGHPKQLEHRTQHIAIGATDDFVFQLKTEKGVYFLKCNATKLLEKTLLGKQFEWGTTYLSWGKSSIMEIWMLMILLTSTLLPLLPKSIVYLRQMISMTPELWSRTKSLLWLFMSIMIAFSAG